MNQTSGLRLYGIIGHPVGHTLSPLLHNTAFEAHGMSASMSAFDIEPQSLREALQGFAAVEFGGLNVTIPHKETIMPLLDEIDEEASVIGAVNTVKFDHGKTIGFNTDSYGFLQTLEPYRSTVDGSKFVVLGAGGAARAVVYVLLRHFRSAQIVIASRSDTRTHDLIENFKGNSRIKLSAVNFADPQFDRILERSDVIINATPAGMIPNTAAMPTPRPHFRNNHLVVDLIYRPIKTLFLQRAGEAGARTISGLDMFIHQGARSFEIWTGKKMDTALAREVLARKLESES